jgi:hypothetical protein
MKRPHHKIRGTKSDRRESGGGEGEGGEGDLGETTGSGEASLAGGRNPEQ